MVNIKNISKKKEINNNKKAFKKYFIILVFLGLLFSILYYFYLREFNHFYNVSYFDYYTKSVVITNLITQFNIKEIPLYYYGPANRVIFFRSLPFMLLFGSSQFVFVYSNFFFNYGLLLFLYYSLTKIFEPKKAFLFILFIMSNYFFLELMASSYVDLSYFFVCSIFFIYLYLFYKNPTKIFSNLVVIIFLLFFIKNTSYLLVPFFLFFMILLLFFMNKTKYIFRFILILVIGFSLYFSILLRFSLDNLLMYDLISTLGHLHGSFGNQINTTFFQNFFSAIYTRGILENFFPLYKFENYFTIFFIYLSLIYLFLSKKNFFFIFLFFVSELFLFFVFNLVGFPYYIRMFLPFYFLYLFLLFEGLLLFITSITTKKKFLIMLLLIFFLFSTNLFFLFNKEPKPLTKYSYSSIKNTVFNRIVELIAANTPPMSKVYIYQDESFFFPYLDLGSLIDKENDFYNLSNIDLRFEFKLIEDPQVADYILCNVCDRFNNSNYQLLIKDSTFSNTLLKLELSLYKVIS